MPNDIAAQQALDQMVDLLMSLPENKQKLTEAMTNYALYGNILPLEAFEPVTPTCHDLMYQWFLRGTERNPWMASLLRQSKGSQ